MKFYLGQPIVCIKDAAWFIQGVPINLAAMVTLPQRGQRYTAGEYNIFGTMRDYDKLLIVELGAVNGARAMFSDSGFAPVTEQLVSEIISKAKRTRVGIKERA